MNIAFITDDGKTISQHFGRALYYLVVSVEDGKEVKRETRAKLGHGQFHGDHGEEEHHGAGHGQDGGSHLKHTQMAEAISDCAVLVCAGMGQGAYDSMLRFNITPVLTELSDIDEALQAYLAGTLSDHPELLH